MCGQPLTASHLDLAVAPVVPVPPLPASGNAEIARELRKTKAQRRKWGSSFAKRHFCGDWRGLALGGDERMCPGGVFVVWDWC